MMTPMTSVMPFVLLLRHDSPGLAIGRGTLVDHHTLARETTQAKERQQEQQNQLFHALTVTHEPDLENDKIPVFNST